MTESETHRQAKPTPCGCGGSVEVERSLPTGQRLDCFDPTELSCGEVELTRSRIPYAVNKLETAQRLLNCQKPGLVVKPSDYRYALSVAPKQLKVYRLTRVPFGPCKKSQN
jgi:hypothetical protein